MEDKMKTLRLSITNTGRKYGFITWKKCDDEQVQLMFGDKKEINIIVDKPISSKKLIDWKRRRIGITYTLTRNLSPTVSEYILTKSKNKEFRLQFE